MSTENIVYFCSEANSDNYFLKINQNITLQEFINIEFPKELIHRWFCLKINEDNNYYFKINTYPETEVKHIKLSLFQLVDLLVKDDPNFDPYESEILKKYLQDAWNLMDAEEDHEINQLKTITQYIQNIEAIGDYFHNTYQSPHKLRGTEYKSVIMDEC